MEVKKITEGMTAPQVAQVIDDNFKGLNEEKANKVETDVKLSELGSNLESTIEANKTETDAKIDRNKEETDEKLSQLELESSIRSVSISKSLLTADNVYNNEIGLNKGILTYDNKLEDNAVFSTTDYIEVNNVSVINAVNAYPLRDAYCGLALYDKNKQFISSHAGGVDVDVSAIANLKYIRVSAKTTPDIICYSYDKNKVKGLVDNPIFLIEGTTSFNATNSMLISGVLDSSGVLSLETSEVFKTSDFIAIANGVEVETFNAYPNVDGYCGLCFYDQNKSVISIHEGNTKVSVPTNAKFFRFSIYINKGKAGANYKGGLYVNLSDKFKELERKEENKASYVIVDAGGNGDYKTISEAVNETKDGDTIMVNPGVYEESVHMYNKLRHIVGVCKETCIVKNGTQRRATPPFEANVGSISNLTILAESYDSEYTEETTPDLAYGIHIDVQREGKHSITIEDCIIKSDWCSAIGIGCRYNQKIHINRCCLETNEGVRDYGALYAHNDDFNPNKGGAQIIVENTTLRGKRVATYIYSLNNGASMDMAFIHNTLWTDINGVDSTIVKVTEPVSNEKLSGSDITCAIYSHGNNIDVLNHNDSYYNSESSDFKEYHRTYDIPQNTDYVINAAYPNYKSCYKFSDNLDSRISALTSIINQNSDVLLIQATTILGGFLRNGVYVEARGWGVSENIDVVGKKTIRVITSVGYSTDIMAIYNSKDEVLYYDKTQESDELKKYDRTYNIPKEASYVRIVCSDIATCFYSFNNGKWFDKTWVTIGDSLTEHNLRATQNYHDYISQETGILVINNGKSGQGYYGDSFRRQIMSITETPDVITIFGSGNDLFKGLPLGDVNDNTTSSLCGYINLTIDYLIEHYPLVPYGIITPCPWEMMEPNENTMHPTLGVENPMRSYCEKMVEICRLRGVPCLDLYHCSNLHPSSQAFREICYTHDDGNGVHPDEKGHKLIAPRFKAFLETLIES